MGLKKRSKVNAEFSMSSLTDIIFLLLIFFMLTSSMVQISMDLPTSNSQTVAPTDMAVMLRLDGSLTYNGKAVKQSEIKRKIQADIAKSESAYEPNGKELLYLNEQANKLVTKIQKKIQKLSKPE